ncbi:MAG: class I mannose-6-phosphate isomerase [Opitutae bacterium]|nr:class I mannose-6-phosphate isomerase [Opitutae bacterium]
MAQFLKFLPLYRERVWGGRGLADHFGRPLPDGGPIGESWEIVDRPEAQSTVRAGRWKGKTLHEVLSAHGAEVMGPAWPGARRFPILVKWLDCRERLSLQVHPPAAVAAKLGGEPKTENWYFAHAKSGAAVIAGLKPGVTIRQFERALARGTVEPVLRRLKVRAGDSLLLRSGTLHAIDAGNVILEVQQNSDTTYRAHDWGRLGLDGQPRPLQVAEALACMAAAPEKPAPLVRPRGRGASTLADGAEFRIRHVRLAPGASLAFAAGEMPRILTVVAGRLRSGGALVARGENVLLPFAAACGFVALEKATVLVTENFHRGPG